MAGHDRDLLADLIRWGNLIRRDLRGIPLVVPPGGLVVIETPSRRNAGAHYTPRSLAEEVVKYALEPVVYEPGPLQTNAVDDWKLKSSTAILDLKVADIAAGSGAFLVAAARFLAKRLTEAWTEEGMLSEAELANPLLAEERAMREVVARCLYGADINPMAVEMCKLSLWLVSLDKTKPFSFVDDKILCGNSLLGVTTLDQLRHLHIDPDRKRKFLQPFVDVDAVLAEATRLRRELASPVDEDDPQRSSAGKLRLLRQANGVTAQLRLMADGIIAAGLALGGKPGAQLEDAYKSLEWALAEAFPSDGSTGNRNKLNAILKKGLTPTVDTDYERWQPLHWAIEVPDVMERAGFDAIVGNPPFLGNRKLTGAFGTEVRDWLINVLAGGTRGGADLVAYFFLRAQSLLAGGGALGLIATNTIAQGDTREVGLDQMVKSGFTITRSIQSRRWPATSVSLEFAAVWGAQGPVPDDVFRVSDDVAVRRISTLLEPVGRLDGHPRPLEENRGIAYQGCILLGKGFIIRPDEAREWITAAAENAEVLLPFLNGDDVNSQPDCSASRWVIDFNDRTESEARRYRLPFEHLLRNVRPERERGDDAVREAPWWLFWRTRQALRKSIAGLDEMLIIARISKTVMPVRVSTKVVPSDSTVVFASDSYADQAVLSSNLHQLWVIKYGTTMRVDPTYTPSVGFEALPRPKDCAALSAVGLRLHSERREIMLRRRLGLTNLYNLVNDPQVLGDPDIGRLRDLHIEIDESVAHAYGWDDVSLDHGFHTYRQIERFTVSPKARVELFDRLLEENYRRAGIANGESVFDQERLFT